MAARSPPGPPEMVPDSPPPDIERYAGFRSFLRIARGNDFEGTRTSRPLAEPNPVQQTPPFACLERLALPRFLRRGFPPSAAFGLPLCQPCRRTRMATTTRSSQAAKGTE